MRLRSLLLASSLAACTGSTEPVNPDDERDASDKQIDGGSMMIDAQLDAPDEMDAAPELEADGALVPEYVTEVRGRMCAPTTPSTCTAAATLVDVHGRSAFGPLHITKIGVDYWEGAQAGTRLWMEGTAGEHHVQISASAYYNATAQAGSPFKELGTYSTTVPDDDDRHMFIALAYCDMGRELENGSLTVERHEFSYGDEVTTDFKGTFKLDEPGWSLELPFALTKICQRTFSL